MNCNNWIISILLIIFCFKSTLQQDVSANSCKTTFDIYKERHANLPFLESNILTSNECITACVNIPTCVGLEVVTTANNSIQCFHHYDSGNFQQIYPTPNTTLIILKRCLEGSMPPPVICGIKWIRTNNSHVFGLTQVGRSSALSAAECLQMCERNSSCRSVDYNRQDKTCFIGFTQNPTTSFLNNVDHYDLVIPIEIECVPVEVETDCQTSFVSFNNKIALGAYQIQYIYTSHDCLSACINMTSCVGVEIETVSANLIKCWHHYDFGDFQNIFDSANVILMILKRCPEDGVFACIGKFTTINVNRASSGGTMIRGVRTVGECQYMCQDAGPACRGMTHNLGTLSCVLHGEDTLNKNVTYNYGPTIEFRMDSVCNKVCIPKWKKLINVAGVGAVQVNLRNYNLTACLEFCVRNQSSVTGSCIGITYTSEPGSPPVCSFYQSHQSASMRNRRSAPYTVQYEIEDSCNPNCLTEYVHFNNSKITLVHETIAPVSTAEECGSWCKVDATCKAFFYSKSGPFVCKIGKSWVYGSEQSDHNYNSVIVTLEEKCRNPNIIPGNRFTPGPPSTTTTTTFPSSPPVCQTEWTKLPYKNSPGLQQYGSANDYTENECRNVCDLYSTCRIVDYNFNDKTCFHGEDPNHYTGNNNAVNHWIIVKRCPGRCNITVSLYAGINSPGLQQLGTAGQYTELKCKDACAADNTCHSCDYNRSDRTCFLGYQSNPPKGYNSVVNHYEFVRAC